MSSTRTPLVDNVVPQWARRGHQHEPCIFPSDARAEIMRDNGLTDIPQSMALVYGDDNVKDTDITQMWLGIWVSTTDTVRNVRLLESNGIGATWCVDADSSVECPDAFTCIRAMDIYTAADNEGLQRLKRRIRTVFEVRSQPKHLNGILIHCSDGGSKCGLAMIALIIAFTGVDAYAAHSSVQRLRPICSVDLTTWYGAPKPCHRAFLALDKEATVCAIDNELKHVPGFKTAGELQIMSKVTFNRSVAKFAGNQRYLDDTAAQVQAEYDQFLFSPSDPPIAHDSDGGAANSVDVRVDLAHTTANG